MPQDGDALRASPLFGMGRVSFSFTLWAPTSLPMHKKGHFHVFPIPINTHMYIGAGREGWGCRKRSNIILHIIEANPKKARPEEQTWETRPLAPSPQWVEVLHRVVDSKTNPHSRSHTHMHTSQQSRYVVHIRWSYVHGNK